MRKLTWFTGVFFFGALLLTAAATAAQGTDIAEDPLSGPGTISVETKSNIMLSFGNRTRIIPTSEGDWDFGIDEDFEGTPMAGTLLNGFGTDFFQKHKNESGWVQDNYIRIEEQVYFNAMPRSRRWSFHGALEFDRPVDTLTVDDRGGYDSETSNFGMERLHGSYMLSENLRLHAGFDIWFMDDPAGLTYGDDAPGFWLNGKYDSFDFSLAYFKASEQNWGAGADDLPEMSGSKDADRDIYAGYMNYHLAEGHKLTGMYMYDRIRHVSSGSIEQKLTGLNGSRPDTDVHYLGAVYRGKAGMLNYFLEGVYRFGEAEEVNANLAINPKMTRDDYDISSYAAAGDVEMDLSDSVGMGFKPHLGFIYTSGDDDPDDGDLEGYDGALSFQRFTRFGGENTIVADTNIMMGSGVYSFLPALYGNGTPIIAGGLANGNPLGLSRGDNPGLTMAGFGFSLKPRFDMTFKTNVNSFWWNEDISVASFAAPPLIPADNPNNPFNNPLAVQNTRVESDYVGTEWDNEFTLAMSRHSFIKAQAALLFPGEMIEDATAARTATLGAFDPQTGQMQVVPGEESDEVAYRFGLEFIWQF
ncbi:MAG TPA: hypothetical protein VKN73_10115 [Desulfosalsimonadaceae bacterium]|nr:hypothetical protein [Desulfosalsimonadaceae bacterium]